MKIKIHVIKWKDINKNILDPIYNNNAISTTHDNLIYTNMLEQIEKLKDPYNQDGLTEVDTQKIDKALSNSWVITFPQGTTKPFAPGRKGTAHIIKNNQPIVVPVVINGFWRAFNKKGLKFKKVGTPLSIRFKEPLVIDYTQSVEHILEQIMDGIEQSKEYMLKGKHHLVQAITK